MCGVFQEELGLPVPMLNLAGSWDFGNPLQDFGYLVPSKELS